MAPEEPVAIWTRALLLLLAVTAFGCAGANPMLHPAHALKQSEISVGGGMSSRITLASTHRRIDEAQATAANNSIDNGDVEQEYITGNLLQRSLDPGLTPWIGGRVGLGNGWEAGVAYMGHRMRVDGRHVFENETEALSLGAAAHALMQLGGSRAPSPGESVDQRLARESFDFSATGGGIEFPVLFGTRRWSRWFEPVIGMRFGYEAVFGSMPLVAQLNIRYPTTREDDPGEIRYAEALAHRFSAEGLIGLSAGSAPVFLRLELCAGLHRAFGSVDFPNGIQPSDEIGLPKQRSFRLWGSSIQPAVALVVEL
jgi:hypothetical protein